MSTTVRQRGTDTSGRAIWMSDRMADWWDGYVERLGFTPTIVQGAWMLKNGGGAQASAGYHDKGGCLDLRVWDRAPAEQAAMVRVARKGGAGAWIRDQRPDRGGMDPHLHLVLGDDHDLADGAAQQWRDYVAGRSGLASRGPDYHPRPSPLITHIPTDWNPDIMATKEELEKIVAAQIKAAVPTADQIADAVWKRPIEIPGENGTRRAGVALRRIYQAVTKTKAAGQ